MKTIKVGVLVNTHGLKGEVKVKPLTDFPQLRFAKKANVYIDVNQKSIELTIQTVRVQKDMLLVTFNGYEDINLVESWKGSTLYIHEEQLHELEDDEAYFYEMMDSEVYDLSNQYIGKVSEIIETGANVVLRVVNGEDMKLIPFVKHFVKEFDKEKKIMHVEMMEGL
ncbi:ribosome maturation factor RimM [Amedibacillus sp. YH-ame10]